MAWRLRWNGTDGHGKRSSLCTEWLSTRPPPRGGLHRRANQQAGQRLHCIQATLAASLPVFAPCRLEPSCKPPHNGSASSVAEPSGCCMLMHEWVLFDVACHGVICDHLLPP